MARHSLLASLFMNNVSTFAIISSLCSIYHLHRLNHGLCLSYLHYIRSVSPSPALLSVLWVQEFQTTLSYSKGVLRKLEPEMTLIIVHIFIKT